MGRRCEHTVCWAANSNSGHLLLLPIWYPSPFFWWHHMYFSLGNYLFPSWSVVEAGPATLLFIPTKGEDVMQARQTHLFLGLGLGAEWILGRKVIGGGPFGWQCPKQKVHRSCHCGPKSSPHSSISWGWSVSLSPDWMNFTNTLQWWAEWKSQRYVHTPISGTYRG